MPDTTVRRPTIHPPQAPDGAHTLVWTVAIPDVDLDGDHGALIDQLTAQFRDEVGALLDRHARVAPLRAFLMSCRFALADLQARDDRAAVAAARRELMWRLARAGWRTDRIGALLHRRPSEVSREIRLHESQQQVAQVRAELGAA